MHTANSPLPFVNEHTSYGTCASAHTYWQQRSYGVGQPAVLNNLPVHVEVGKGKLAGALVVVVGGALVLLFSVVLAVVVDDDDDDDVFVAGLEVDGEDDVERVVGLDVVRGVEVVVVVVLGA